MPVAEREWEPSTIRTGLCGDGGVTARCLEMTRDEDDVRPFIMNTGDAVWPYWQEEEVTERRTTRCATRVESRTSHSRAGHIGDTDTSTGERRTNLGRDNHSNGRLG